MKTRRSALKALAHGCAGLAALAASNAEACATARGVVDADPAGKNARFTNPALTAQTMAWAAKILVV